MRRIKAAFRLGLRPSRVLAAAMMLLFLSVIAFATSPALHELIHADAGDAHHQCAITALAHSQMDVAVCDFFVAVPPACFELIQAEAPSFSSPIVELFPPGRAPPFLA